MGFELMDLQLFIQIMPQLLRACVSTLHIAFFSTVIGLVGGTVLALAQRSSFLPMRWSVNSLVAVLRGTPMLVQIVFFYYGLNLPFTPLTVAILAIGLNSSAYTSQVIKAGIDAVDRGQIEAATVLGFSKTQITRYIILPQAFAIVLPALSNEFVNLIKDSSLAYIIGGHELFKEGRTIINSTYDVATVYLAVAFLYFIMTSLVTFGVSFFEPKEETC